jgi:hypothetical protein
VAVCGHHNDWDVRVSLHCPDIAEKVLTVGNSRFPSIADRDLEVEQDIRVGVAGEEIAGAIQAGRAIARMAKTFESVFHIIKNRRIIVNRQRMKRHSSFPSDSAASVTMIVVPTFSLLSMASKPPWASIFRLAVGKPNPVP